MWREVLNQDEHWDFVLAQPPHSGAFLQTPAWAEYQRRLGNTTKELVYVYANRVAAICVLVRSPLPANFFYWLAPKGPRFSSTLTLAQQQEASADLFAYLKRENGVFFRLEPAVKPAAVKKVKEVNPRATVMVKLEPDFAEILASMHEKTRYNMRLAERRGLKFRWGESEDFQKFWQLLEATSKREGFKTHQRQHYQVMFDIFAKEPLTTKKIACRLGLVEYQGALLAASLVLVANSQATYLHGASTRERRDLMAPYMLHGSTIRLLKEAGIASYDMWGVQPKDGSLPNWSGFTRFKMGWGGEYWEDPGTFDYVIRPLPYLMYKIARRIF